MASGSSSAQPTVARMEGTLANDELGGAPRKKAHTKVDLELDVFYNPALRAYTGWENGPQPWSAKTAMKYENFAHFDCLRPESSHVAHYKAKDAKYSHIEDLEVKWRFLTILRGKVAKKCDSEMYGLSNIRRACPKSKSGLVHSKIHQQEDWTNWRCLGNKKPVHIPYEPIPKWFRQNPKFVDKPGRQLPPDRTPKRPRWRLAPQNPIDIVLWKVFEAMKMDVEGNDDGANQCWCARRG